MIGNAEIYGQICSSGVIDTIWKLSNDDEGFVKASALNCLCQLCDSASDSSGLDFIFKEDKVPLVLL